MLSVIQKHLEDVNALCRKYNVERLDLFGSAVRDDFDDQLSDLDFVVQFKDFTIQNAFDKYFGLMTDLEVIFKRRIDLVSYRAIRNPFFKQVVDRTRVTLYAA